MRNEKGQATVELAVMLPIAVALAAVAVNAVLFTADCAAFDRTAAQAIRVHGTSSQEGVDEGRQQVARELKDSFDRKNLSVSVSASGGLGAHTTYVATLRYRPTLFGMGLKSSVLGVALPVLTHTTSLVVEAYKPGVFL